MNKSLRLILLCPFVLLIKEIQLYCPQRCAYMEPNQNIRNHISSFRKGCETNFSHRKIFGNHTWDCNLRKPFWKISQKKVVYNQSVPHIHPPTSPFVGGRESILPRNKVTIPFIFNSLPNSGNIF